MSNRKSCSVPDCETMRPFQNLFCWPHWSMLPKPLQRRITIAWHPGKGNYRWTPAVRAAIKAAVTYIKEAE